MMSSQSATRTIGAFTRPEFTALTNSLRSKRQQSDLEPNITNEQAKIVPSDEKCTEHVQNGTGSDV